MKQTTKTKQRGRKLSLLNKTIMSVELPSYSDYMRVVEGMINKNELTVEQGIILRCCYNATVNERPVNVNYLMSATGLNWKRISAILNGLVLKGAIRVHDKKWYTL